MKVGIITIHNSPNYGASLQSYALYRYIANQGVDCEIIDLHRPHEKDYISSKHFFLERPPHKTLKAVLKRFLRRCLDRISRQASPAQEVARERFGEFNGRIPLSRPYRGLDELYADPPQYDLYITGSDQVWNPTQPYVLDPFFLTFVRSGRKISYASSIGIEELTEREKEKFKSCLASYEKISVREKKAQALLEKSTGRKVGQVADPTFLLTPEEWSGEAAGRLVEGCYIFCFLLAFDGALLDYASRLARQSGKQLVVLARKRPKNHVECLFVEDAGPREWLSYVEHADLVLTDSFHCTVFSLILGVRNFYTYIPSWNKRGSRITDLLETYGLTGHLLDNSFSETYAELSRRAIDRRKVLHTMEQEAERSREFLLGCLRNKDKNLKRI